MEKKAIRLGDEVRHERFGDWCGAVIMLLGDTTICETAVAYRHMESATSRGRLMTGWKDTVAWRTDELYKTGA